jgi:hypothetical protein
MLLHKGLASLLERCLRAGLMTETGDREDAARAAAHWRRRVLVRLGGHSDPAGSWGRFRGTASGRVISLPFRRRPRLADVPAGVRVRPAVAACRAQRKPLPSGAVLESPTWVARTASAADQRHSVVSVDDPRRSVQRRVRRDRTAGRRHPPVSQMPRPPDRLGRTGLEPSLAQAGDRLAVQVLCRVAFAEQRMRPRLGTQHPVAAAGIGDVAQLAVARIAVSFIPDGLDSQPIR